MLDSQHMLGENVAGWSLRQWLCVHSHGIAQKKKSGKLGGLNLMT